MSSRLFGALAFGALLVSGCTPKPKESKVAHDVKIVKEENEPTKLFERGKQFHALGDLTRAEQYYAAAMQTGYPESKVLPLLLRVCIESNRLQVAIEYAEPVLKKNPADHKLRLVLASLYTAIGQHATARSYLERVTAEHPDEPTPHYALAVLLRDEFHDHAGADRHFREYLRLAPDGSHAEEAKGSLLKDVSPAPASSSSPAPVGSGAPPTPLVSPAPASSAPSKKPVKLP